MNSFKSVLSRILTSLTMLFAGMLLSIFIKELYISCSISNPVAEELSYNDSLRIKILQSGDTIAYANIKKVMKSEGFPHECLFYSIVMARQYHYLPAYNDVAEILKQLYQKHSKEAGEEAGDGSTVYF